MKRLIFTTLLTAIFSTLAFTQNLTQTVRGTLIDIDSKLPLIGAAVIILDSDPIIGAVTDLDGNFRIENVPTGRISLKLSYIGYETKTIPNVEINSGKEVILKDALQESAVQLDEVVVRQYENKGDALNEMSLVSARSISVEETKRYAGGFDDPSRVVSNYAGVANTPDGSSDIIVRGNSPKYLQWRLDGVEISSPYHFDDQNSSFGGLSALNNNLLAASDFYTGAFSPEFGDVLSGVYNVNLRSGNNEKFEAMFGLGLLGADVTLEGPVKKGYAGSYLINYRYSTASLITDLGLVDVGGTPKYQDATFKLLLPTKKAGTFSIFGITGLSGWSIEDITPAIAPTPGNRTMSSELTEDYDKSNFLINTGVNHTYSLNSNSFLKTSLTFSSNGIADEIYESRKVTNSLGEVIQDSVYDRRMNYDNNLTKSAYRASITYNHKLNAKHKIQIGGKYTLSDYNFKQSKLQKTTSTMLTQVDFREHASTISSFISWRYRMNENITFVSGIHNMNVLLNNQSTLEPRVALNWKLNRTSKISAGYGMHSNMESIHHYFAKVEQPDGSIIEPNKDLGLLKAHHFVLGYEKRFSKNLMAKAEVYYQALYNLPVENLDTSYFATINEGIDHRYVDLVNEGTGKNYGIEITLERFFDNNYFFLLNGSVFNSTYKALEGVERNTRYNNNYLLNALVGKEFNKLGRKKNQTLAINAKLFVEGGQKYIPLLRDGDGNLAVNPETNTFWDYSKAYESSLDNIFQLNLSVSYKFNRPNTTHEIFLDLQNLTNNMGRVNEYYNESEPNSIGYMKQFGFFPNLMYRVYL